jgi:non-heme chloroperoxidase
MTPVMNVVKLPDQVRLPYVEQGDPKGVPVLFLHGYTDSWRSFEGVLAHLPGSLHAFALSQRGHGDADRPAAGYHPREFAADLAAFMDALDIRQAVIAGHSMGGSVAQWFAIDYPERTLGLVLMGAFTGWRDSPVLMEFWDSAVSTLTDPIDPTFVREFQQSTLARPVPPGRLDTAVGESLKVPARVWRATYEAFLDAAVSRHLGQILSPTLVIWGDQDTFALQCDQDALHAAIPGSQVVVYPGAGHSFHWEEPERFAIDVAAFASSLVR